MVYIPFFVSGGYYSAARALSEQARISSIPVYSAAPGHVR